MQLDLYGLLNKWHDYNDNDNIVLFIAGGLSKLRPRRRGSQNW
jgi:hypothetical protein